MTGEKERERGDGCPLLHWEVIGQPYRATHALTVVHTCKPATSYQDLHTVTISLLWPVEGDQQAKNVFTTAQTHT